MVEMYVGRSGGLYALRQERFRARLAAGREHPHDVCAVAHSREELKEMCLKYWPDVDYGTDERLEARKAAGHR
jgi:hypothetical protein